MTIRNLEYLLEPTSVALIGGSKKVGSVGAVVARNLLNAGFNGPVMPVNPKHLAIEGVLTYPDIASLPVTPDLAVIATPPDSVPGLVAELADRGTRGVVVITAGFSEGDSEHGRMLEQAMLDVAKPSLVRIVGPNCLGLMVPGIGLNAGFAHLEPLRGRLAFTAQSGAVVTSVLDWATGRGIGFSHLVSLGDMADVDFGDMLDYLATDVKTRAILLYIESVKDARKFMSAARAAARSKHVIVVKSGRHAESAAAASSHTGAMAGSDDVYDTAFRRAGMLRVRTLEELFDAVETLTHLRQPRNDRLAILTNGGGLGVMATDDLLDHRGRLAELAPETLERLNKALPETWSHGNPVDIIGDAPGSRYSEALEALFSDRGVDAVLVMNCPTAVASSTEAAQSTVEVTDRYTDRTVLTSWVGDEAARESRKIFEQHGVPSFQTPKQAVRAFMHMVDYHRNQESLMETPPAIPETFTPDTRRASEILRRALTEGRDWLSEPEAKEMLDAYAIPVAKTGIARTPEEAAEMAAEIDGSVVLKILSPDITHKSDVGGVALGLANPAAVEEAARAMLSRIEKKMPEASLEGFSVQPHVRRKEGFELIAGVVEDDQFGPAILFGKGGTAVEIVRDKALALPPLNMHLAHEVMSRTRIHRLLQGYRGRPAVDLDALALTLIKISQLAIDMPEVAELDINPLVADENGVIALDARIRVAVPKKPTTERLAIRPYPKELEETIALGDGREFMVRPVRPEDEPAFQRTFAQLTPEEVRLRFFAPIKTLTHMAAVRFTQLDYDREMALVVAEPGRAGLSEIYGIASLALDPHMEKGEYAILVRGDLTGAGLGIFLMRRIIDYASRRGLVEIWGDVLRDNKTMLKMCRVLGFTQHAAADDPSLVRVRLDLENER
jgi:acetyltransferase